MVLVADNEGMLRFIYVIGESPMHGYAAARVLFLSLVAAMISTGCTRKVYEIQLKPDGTSIERTLTVWSETTSADKKVSPLPEGELRHFRQFYDSANDRLEGDKHVFSGRFEGEMPQDVGGAGSYTHFESPLGSTSLYSERFRGEDDLQDSIAKRNQAVDKIIALLLHWARNELPELETRQRIEVFLDQDLRRDLMNLSAYCLTHAMLSDLDEQEIGKRLAARMAQYLVERDYVRWQEVPRLLRVFSSEDPDQFAGLLHATVIRKLGIPEGESLAILADAERLANSLRESFRETEIYRTELARYQEEHPADDEGDSSEEIDPLGLLAGFALEATLPKSGSGWTVVEVDLECGIEPFATNGTWDEESKSVSWNDSIDDATIPVLAFAAWSQPDVENQERLFGSTVLSGEELAKYVFWYRGLNESEREQWDEFFSDVTPDDDWRERLDRFEFPEADQLAEVARRLLSEALTKTKTE